MPVSNSFTIIKYILLELLSANLQLEVNHLKEWCNNNSLTINTSKIKDVIFSNKRSNPSSQSITFRTYFIEQVDTCKYLDTMFHKKLNFDEVTNDIIRKAKQKLFITKQLTKLKVKPSTIQLAYKTFIDSILLYHLPEYMDISLTKASSTITISSKLLAG